MVDVERAGELFDTSLGRATDGQKSGKRSTYDNYQSSGVPTNGRCRIYEYRAIRVHDEGTSSGSGWPFRGRCCAQLRVKCDIWFRAKPQRYTVLTSTMSLAANHSRRLDLTPPRSGISNGAV